MIGTRRHAAAAAALLPAVTLLTGCSGSDQNALAPESHQSGDIASMFWWMVGGAWIGLALIVALLIWSWRRAHRPGLGGDTHGDKPGEKAAWYVVLGLGIATPIVVMAAIFVIGDIFVIKTTEAPAANATKLTVQVIGHQWWWEVRYPGTTAVTANELHIPVRTPVRIDVTTADVIHSFWVPRLNRTIDAIPGRVNSIELYADAVGRYRGQCDEFCGLQHAHMAFYVYADPPAKFRTWLANQEQPVRAPLPAAFNTAGCSTCHTIRGTSASGDVGPDLTHLASRSTLAALAIPNRRDYLAHWIVDAQSIKPGNLMPNLHLSSRELSALLTYLKGLK
ncbi:MAG TPA: cytochrome c oxidase subunit II [Gaiellaceae bacterium]|nr:cytochrome c oxidase subunit II [Gaiellaceae bacterium]